MPTERSDSAEDDSRANLTIRDCQRVEDESDDLWLSTLAKLWKQQTGQDFDTLDGETREEGIEANLEVLFSELSAARQRVSELETAMRNALDVPGFKNTAGSKYISDSLKKGGDALCQPQAQQKLPDSKLVSNAAPVVPSHEDAAEKPCCHEWYQGYCCHCEVSAKDFRAGQTITQLRTRIKELQEYKKADTLRADNDRLQRESAAMREALDVAVYGMWENFLRKRKAIIEASDAGKGWVKRETLQQLYKALSGFASLSVSHPHFWAESDSAALAAAQAELERTR